jgi:hypothetical protein
MASRRARIAGIGLAQGLHDASTLISPSDTRLQNQKPFFNEMASGAACNARGLFLSRGAA